MQYEFYSRNCDILTSTLQLNAYTKHIVWFQEDGSSREIGKPLSVLVILELSCCGLSLLHF